MAPQVKHRWHHQQSTSSTSGDAQPSMDMQAFSTHVKLSFRRCFAHAVASLQALLHEITPVPQADGTEVQASKMKAQACGGLAVGGQSKSITWCA
eukprot:1150340-Pelagomonas_calceolata.AAC.5